MHITITGNLGSGKSTICNILKDKYGFEIYSTGKIQRELAAERNMSVLEFNQAMCSDPQFDHMIDEATRRISREKKDQDIIFDSRLAWNFAEESFKVFLSVSLDESAKRVMNDQKRGKVEKYGSVEEARKLLKKRAETENIRYKDIYNLDYFDFSNYNLVVDSTYCGPDKIAEIIMDQAKKYQKTQAKTLRRLVSPKRVIHKSEISLQDKKEFGEIARNHKDEEVFSGGTVKVREEDDKFIIVEGLEKAKTAYLSNADFIEIS